ncbi:hypothetical protein [Yinghuangia sp. YIM S09857]|uniref:hypothetical protein n=1 Tax=Yinghuangia sp. YIM S09857 TaxID=3436929 RepID=UPI003F538C94
MRKLMARVVLRSALAISAVGIVTAAGVFGGDSNSSTPDRSGQSAHARAAAYGMPVPAHDPERGQAPAPLPGAESPRTEPAGAGASSYTLRTENGPRAALAARIVTATLLLTGLVLTGLGAIGMRGPSLLRRPADDAEPVADDAPPYVGGAGEPGTPAYAPLHVPRPGGHPRFGPPPT